MSNYSPDGQSDRRDHLEEVEPGAGCAEIWEHLSERRANPSAESPADD